MSKSPKASSAPRVSAAFKAAAAPRVSSASRSTVGKPKAPPVTPNVASSVTRGQLQGAATSPEAQKKVGQSNVLMSKAIADKAKSWTHKTFSATRKKAGRVTGAEMPKNQHAAPKGSAKKVQKDQRRSMKEAKSEPKIYQRTNFELSKSIIEQAKSWKHKSFSTTRKKLHKALAEDPSFLKTVHATPENLKRMRAGKAPFAPENEQLGNRKLMEFDHKWERRDGVKENRVDNLRLVSPLKHKTKIMRKFHKAAGTEMPKDLRDPVKYQKPLVSQSSSAQKLKKPLKLF